MWILNFQTIVVVVRLIPIIILSFALPSCNKGKNNPNACNGSSTRREVKLTTDELANQIDTNRITIGVKEIGELDVPEIDSDDDRQEVEKKVFTIRALVHKISKHRDGDWKVKLTDEEDHFINCEAPNPGCEFMVDSRFESEILEVRSWLDEHAEDLEGKVVEISGVGFIDIDHRYPRNAAENEMEIHPILSISF
jgi:hypothetical protein